MATRAPDPRAHLLYPPDLTDLFGSMALDVAATGTIDDARDALPWRTASGALLPAVADGWRAGCELTCSASDDGLQAFTANDGVWSVTTRTSVYDSAEAAGRTLTAVQRSVRAGHGPAGICDRAPVAVEHISSRHEAGRQKIAIDVSYANPDAPVPHPVTLRFGIPPRTWGERWLVIRYGALIGVVIVRFVGRPPDLVVTAELERRVLGRLTGGRSGAADSAWIFDDDVVADRFHVAYEASSEIFRAATRTALTEIDRVLPGPPMRVRILRSPTMNEHYAGGLTRAGGTVLLYARLENLDLVPRLLKSILAHELHHSVRTVTGPGRQDLRSLLGTIVLEGLGTVFQLEVCPEIPIRYAEALDPETEAVLWWQAQAELDQPLGPHAGEWFYGTGHAPRWAGYTIGAHIVRGYLAVHPGMTAADLTGTDATVILSESLYAP